MEDTSLSEGRLNAAFEQWWPLLDEKLKAIQTSDPIQPIKSSGRSDRELLEELLELSRGQERVRQLEPNITPHTQAEFIRSSDEPTMVVTKGIINPAMFEYFGKRMRMAFLTVDNLAEIAEKVKGQDFEVLATLGPHDLVITHLHENRYDMIYDIKQVLNWRSSLGQSINPSKEVTDDIYNNFPFFRVDFYFKFLGVPIDPSHFSVFNRPQSQVPTVEERIQIMRLGMDWNDEDIPKETRDKFLEKKWILSVTSTRPEEINYIMTIFLEHGVPQIEERLAIFETKVIPELVKHTIITSIYRGRSQRLAIHYVLRISANFDFLYALINEIHNLTLEARVLIITKTYVVIKKESDLSLEKAILAPLLPTDEANYRNSQIVPRLSKEDRARLIYLPQESQRDLIKQYERVQSALDKLSIQQLPHEQLEEIKNKLAKGLLDRDFTELKKAHDTLQIRVETLLQGFIKKGITKEQFDSWRVSLNIQSGRKKEGLSFAERIKLVIRLFEESGQHTELLAPLLELTRTTQLRNMFVHGDFDRISFDQYIDGLVIYCMFLSSWDW